MNQFSNRSFPLRHFQTSPKSGDLISTFLVPEFMVLICNRPRTLRRLFITIGREGTDPFAYAYRDDGRNNNEVGTGEIKIMRKTG